MLILWREFMNRFIGIDFGMSKVGLAISDPSKIISMPLKVLRYKNPKNLIEDLIIESIKIYGYDNFYIPRTLVKEDDLFGEDVLSKFDSAYAMEMYVKNVEGFDGEGEFLSKFNLEVRDQITFSIAQRRYLEEIPEGAVKLDEQGEKINRPVEGDLIFFPLTSLYLILFIL